MALNKKIQDTLTRVLALRRLAKGTCRPTVDAQWRLISRLNPQDLSDFALALYDAEGETVSKERWLQQFTQNEVQ